MPVPRRASPRPGRTVAQRWLVTTATGDARRAAADRAVRTATTISVLRRVGVIAAGGIAIGVPVTGWIGARVLTDAPRWRAPRPTLTAWFHGPADARDARIMSGHVHIEGPDADAAGTWGLAYDGGYAQVLDPIDWLDTPLAPRVVRPYRPLEGVAPTWSTQIERRRGDRRRGDRRRTAPASQRVGPTHATADRRATEDDDQHGTGADQRRGTGADQRRGTGADQRRGTGADQRRGTGADQRRGTGADDRRDRGERRTHQEDGPWPVRAALSSYAFAHDPQLLAGDSGATFSIEAVPSLGGHLPAWRFTPRPPAPGDRDLRDVWVIGVHGRGARRTELFRIVHTALRAGATSLVTSYRTDGWTRDPALMTTLGQTEWEDVDAAVRMALDAGARRVVLAGCSLGGAISAQVLRRSTIADRIDGVILDSPALHWPQILQHVAERRHLPRPLIPLVMAAARVRAKLDWEALDHLSTTDQLRHPILLIHGTEDPTVPVWLSDALAAARPDLVTYVRVPGAGHVRSWNTDRVRYEHAVTSFLQAAGDLGGHPRRARDEVPVRLARRRLHAD